MKFYKFLLFVSVIVPILFFALFFLYPVLALVFRGFFDVKSGGFTFDYVISTILSYDFLRSLWYTIFISFVASTLSVFLGLPLAYVFYCLDFWGHKFWRCVLMIPFILPTAVVGVAFRMLFAENGYLGFLKLDGSVFAIIIAMVFFNLCVAVRIIGTYWQGIDYRVVDVARALGANAFYAFRTVVLPALRPGIFSAFSVIFLFCATSFSVVLIMGGSSVSTIETQIYILTTQFLDLKSASIFSLLQIFLVLFLVFFVGNFDSSMGFGQTISGKNIIYKKLKSIDLFLIILSFIVIILLIILPISILVLRSFTRDNSFTFANYVDLFKGDLPLFGGVNVFATICNSIVTALVSALISIFIGFCVAFVLSRRASRTQKFHVKLTENFQRFFDFLFILPLGISSATVGFGFLITVNVLLFDTMWQWLLVPMAQATVAIPLVVRAIVPIVKGIDDRQIDASRILGANLWQCFKTIEWHYFLHALLGAYALALAVSFGEFGATSFLFRPDGVTLPVLVYSLISKPAMLYQGLASASCVILTIVVSVLLLLAGRFSK